MEDLTKQQVILLTLLVSFVTSIATGIVTVSLVNQAPAGVTQTINQVIEKTIERVVPSQSAGVTTSATISLEDATTNAVDTIQKSTVDIKAKTAYSADTIVGTGLIVSKEGVILTDKSILSPQSTYVAVLPSGQEFPLSLIQTQSYGDIAFLVIQIPDAVKPTTALHPIKILSTVKLGQTVLNLSKKDTDIFSQGIVEKVGGDSASQTSPIIISITTSISPEKSLLNSPLFTLTGDVVGFKTASLISSDSNVFYPLTLIKDAIPVVRR